MRVVLCGSFRRDRAGYLAAFDALVAAGHRVVSPEVRPEFLDEDPPGFVRLLADDGGLSPSRLEWRHLEAIRHADAVWLHVGPDGHVGVTSAMEVGFARGAWMGVHAAREPAEPTVAGMVRVGEIFSPDDRCHWDGTCCNCGEHCDLGWDVCGRCS